MRLKPSPKARPEAIPQLIIAGRILQVGSQELETAILKELEENPALELVEEPFFSAEITVPSSEEETAGPLEMVASATPLEEFLLEQMRPHLDAKKLTIAQVLVESLDSHGLLPASAEEVGELASAPVAEVEEVLALLQDQEPAGIGAQSVQECLLLQLRRLEEEGREQGPAHKLARALIAEHWEELGKASLERLAAALKAKPQEIQEALDFIHHNLNPFPAHAYASPDTEAAPVRPDVVVRSPGVDQELVIELPEEGRYRLRVNPLYQESQKEDLTSQEQEHLRVYSDRARLFISAFEQRWRTMRRILEVLLEEQKDFFLHGPRYLKPMSRASLAQALGLHESTVSRAVANKYLQLPHGRLVPLADLFDGSLSIKDHIREMVAQEEVPLSDAQVASLLRKEGIKIARRTVAKYREQMGILPAPLRRRAKGVN